MNPRIVFVTGTDTSAGKTILTALLLLHAQAQIGAERERTVAALKPFCSGGREDAQLLHALQNEKLALDQINPFHFPDPLSPWTAAKIVDRQITLAETVMAIRSVPADLLLIEGAGGLLAPLGERFHALDLIAELQAEVIIAAPNKLGVLNHALLTLHALRTREIASIRFALIDLAPPDLSAFHNASDLAQLTGRPIVPIPHLTGVDPEALQNAARTLHPRLAELLPLLPA